MNERAYLDVISGRRRGVIAGVMRVGLALLTPFYRMAVITRYWLFDTGLKTTHSVDVPVISIGNITTGGTGKTPVVAWVTQWLTSQGKQPGIVSRGYRSLDDAGNDELRVLEQLCPGVPHVQSHDRLMAARKAIASHDVDVIVLDDGFQHRRLHRDLDIVLVDATNPWGYGHLLPRGLLREPHSALCRADIIVLTRVDHVDEDSLKRVRQQASQLTVAPLAEVGFRPTGMLSLSGKTVSLEALMGENVFAFCGIGNPEGFRRTLSDAGIMVADDAMVTFADHHHYTEAEFVSLAEQAKSQRVTALVTTQKDLVKLDPSWETSLPVWALTIGAEIVAGREKWQSLLNDLLNKQRTSS
ncbi:MAG: tetraacyldisaccharide 4'-kinase [Planctomycetaceae bacterium]|nr:tetraacyldisaccharide 4'-kinase [Planctomycetaceae bacterium]